MLWIMHESENDVLKKTKTKLLTIHTKAKETAKMTGRYIEKRRLREFDTHILYGMQIGQTGA